MASVLKQPLPYFLTHSEAIHTFAFCLRPLEVKIVEIYWKMIEMTVCNGRTMNQNMAYMFAKATYYNQPLEIWNV
jgi:hypothetical protein